MTTPRIALLRGINVGGHRKVPMAELRALLTNELGLEDVSTYIQSGNVVFSDGDGSERGDIESSVSDAVERHFGFEIPVVVRDATTLSALLERSAEWCPVVDDDPTHDKRVTIGFLTAIPAADAVARLDPERSPGDSVLVERDHAHISYEVGQGSTKLTGDYIERVLGVGMTVRNLATVRKLVEMSSTLGS